MRTRCHRPDDPKCRPKFRIDRFTPRLKTRGQSPSVHHERKLLSFLIRDWAGTQLRGRNPCQESSSVRPIGRTAVKGELRHHNQHFNRNHVAPVVKSAKAECRVDGS